MSSSPSDLPTMTCNQEPLESLVLYPKRSEHIKVWNWMRKRCRIRRVCIQYPYTSGETRWSKRTLTIYSSTPWKSKSDEAWHACSTHHTWNNGRRRAGSYLIQGDFSRSCFSSSPHSDCKVTVLNQSGSMGDVLKWSPVLATENTWFWLCWLHDRGKIGTGVFRVVG
jgi:hypothetical protein